MPNYERLDKVVAAMVKRDEQLKPLLEDAVFERDDVLYLRASALAKYLGYATLGSFQACIARAQITAANSGRLVADHFVDTTVFEGSQDTLLTLWATNATIMEADPKKKRVAVAKSYFASQAAERGRIDEERLKERQIAKHNHKRLHAAAEEAGIQTTRQHAIFDDAGYRAMYGSGVREVGRMKGVPADEKLMDCADYTELAANNLRMSMTTDKLRREEIRQPVRANHAHAAVGGIIREAVKKGSGMPPEKLPLAPKTIDELAKDKAAELKEIR